MRMGELNGGAQTSFSLTIHDCDRLRQTKMDDGIHYSTVPVSPPPALTILAIE